VSEGISFAEIQQFPAKERSQQGGKAVDSLPFTRACKRPKFDVQQLLVNQ
jgi:hypothetical protein